MRPVPVGAITQPATRVLMQASGGWWPRAHFEPELMACLAGAAHTVLDFDFVRVPFDQTIEAELLGCPLEHGGGASNCAVRSNPWSLDSAPPPMPDLHSGRSWVVSEALAILKREMREDAAVVGGLVGPFTLVSQLVGVSSLLMDALRRPDLLRPWLEFAVNFAAEYARLQIQAGADTICVEDMSASLDLTSPGIYRNLILPAQQALIAAIPAPVILHVCGDNTRIIGLLQQTGAAALSLEDRTDLKRAVEGPCSIVGGIAPVEVLLNGNAEAVARASAACLEAGVRILAPGCGVAPETPTENLREMVRVAREWNAV